MAELLTITRENICVAATPTVSGCSEDFSRERWISGVWEIGGGMGFGRAWGGYKRLPYMKLKDKRPVVVNTIAQVVGSGSVKDKQWRKSGEEVVALAEEIRDDSPSREVMIEAFTKWADCPEEILPELIEGVRGRHRVEVNEARYSGLVGDPSFVSGVLNSGRASEYAGGVVHLTSANHSLLMAMKGKFGGQVYPTKSWQGNWPVERVNSFFWRLGRGEVNIRLRPVVEGYLQWPLFSGV